VTGGDVNLQQMIDYLHLETPDEIYKRGLPHALLAKARGEVVDAELTDLYKLDKGDRKSVV